MEQILEIINVIGIISFSAAGAMVAIDKENDCFGVIFMSLVTCFCGGMLRDVLVGHVVGRTMPVFFYDMKLEIIVCICTAFVVFLLAMIFKEKYVKEEASVEKINNVLDALGIGVFTAAGTQAYIEVGFGVAMCMGLLSSIGGSVTRDVILGEIPTVFRKRVYALACMGGSVVYYVFAKYIMEGKESSDVVATLACISFIFVIRMCATAFKWDIPKAIDFAKIKAKQEESREDKDHITQ